MACQSNCELYEHKSGTAYKHALNRNASRKRLCDCPFALDFINASIVQCEYILHAEVWADITDVCV